MFGGNTYATIEYGGILFVPVTVIKKISKNISILSTSNVSKNMLLSKNKDKNILLSNSNKTIL